MKDQNGVLLLQRKEIKEVALDHPLPFQFMIRDLPHKLVGKTGMFMEKNYPLKGGLRFIDCVNGKFELAFILPWTVILHMR